MSDEARVRRAPPPFRRAQVVDVAPRSARLLHVDIAGPELVGIPMPEPAGSVRVLLPGATGLVIPEWTGNLFVLPDGTRATIRTLTPVDTDPAQGTLALEIVLHGPGRAADWATQLEPGDELALSGPARGWVMGATDRSVVIAGDESALPAIRQLVTTAADRRLTVVIEVGAVDGIVALPVTDPSTVEWVVSLADAPPGTALADAVAAMDLEGVDHLWAGGEAAAVQRIRRDLFEVRGWSRDRATVRGYWKFGRTASG